MKKILGLDLGTNSIGWALVNQDFENKQGEILGMGSRIIPMSQDILGDFSQGNSISQTAKRTDYRGIRRLRERHLLRRERLHRTLNILGFLPEHYAKQIDFDNRLGQFIPETEPKLTFKNKTFIFKKSFEEMVNDFRINQPQLTENGKSIPSDWTIYFLRKKALTHKIEKEELAWLLLNFNQKRGYHQLRGEDEEENKNKLIEFYSLKIIDVKEDQQPKKNGEIWYSLELENGWIYRRSSKTSLVNWKDKVRDFIVTTELDDVGSIKLDKEGNEKRSFRAPKEDDWTLIKKRTEKEIYNSKKTVGVYIFDELLRNPNQKIKGNLIRTIERKFYKSELERILRKQKEFHPELQNEKIYNNCVKELYRNNSMHQMELAKKDIIHLLLEDIIFYQRPLKSKKSLISDCTFEYKVFKDEAGNEKINYLKAIPKSNPIYQEFRLLQWMFNLRIYRKEDDSNVTSELLNNVQEQEDLFEFLNDRNDIEQKILLKYLFEKKGLKGRLLNNEVEKYRWNFVQDKKYPCNETKHRIKTRLSNVIGVNTGFLTHEIEQKIWHIVYSVTDKTEYEKAIKTFARKESIDSESFFENFKNFPPFKSEYGSYSYKAINKLLKLMRFGKYWDWENIDSRTKDRIDKILTGEFDEEIKNKVRDKSIHLSKENQFQGLPLWLANYIVYGAASYSNKWSTITDIDKYLKEFQQHSLRNPIVEQVVMESIRVVKDVWQHYGHGAKDFFDEIHIELGREMKKTKEERKRDSSKIFENENTNLRIKALLSELKNDETIDNVRPFSPMQQEILKIYEDGILSSSIEIPEDIAKISKTAQPSTSELQRYKLWLEQKYRSPYTGQIIPLSRLFTIEYEIEHIIPQSRYFDNSFNNKVICESSVNRLKDNQTGLEFIKNHHGQILENGFGEKIVIFEEEEYKDFVSKNYLKNRSKRNKLLLEDIPEKMIERQINDTRYISLFISSILSNIIRSEQNDDGINSKNLLQGNGKITSLLKQNWGLNDIWNDLVLPRFERLNELNNSSIFTTYNEKCQKYLPTVPLELSKGFQLKRIDHRHHALDALIIACMTRDHINLLNNTYANSVKRFDLNRKLRQYGKVTYVDKKINKKIEKEIPKEFLKPWGTFTVEARRCLDNIVVSYKQNLRVINKANNKYEKWVVKNGRKIKVLKNQTKGDNWSIRKSMHQATFSGLVQLSWVTTPKGKITSASRKPLDTSFNFDRILKITDTGIQKILKNYLLSKGGDAEIAFTPEGIAELVNRNETNSLFN
ncbi:MAG: HNH endonuclease domain-containing protein [Ignavibacteria bacterium]|nr:HNH endonuclease domain-containing protein [Ignavibacteria bacterium]